MITPPDPPTPEATSAARDWTGIYETGDPSNPLRVYRCDDLMIDCTSADCQNSAIYVYEYGIASTYCRECMDIIMTGAVPRAAPVPVVPVGEERVDGMRTCMACDGGGQVLVGTEYITCRECDGAGGIVVYIKTPAAPVAGVLSPAEVFVLLDLLPENDAGDTARLALRTSDAALREQVRQAHEERDNLLDRIEDMEREIQNAKDAAAHWQNLEWQNLSDKEKDERIRNAT